MQIIELNNNFFDKQLIADLLEKKICFIGVFSELCIHCKNMKSQWNTLKKKLKNMHCNSVLLEIDSSQLNNIDYSSLTNSINGFPSIMIFNKGKKIKDYNGNRSSNDMFKFFKHYLLINKKKTKKNITICKKSKNGKNGCRKCCSQFKKRKTFKNCKKLCMKN